MNKGKINAVIIGISKYQDPDISRLKYTNSDALALANLLRDKNRCGIPDDNIKLLLDENATCFNIKDAISDWLYYKADKDGTALIFFAGHGGSERSRKAAPVESSERYLLPYDTKLKNLYASAISCLTFNDLLDRVNVKSKVIFMDACYSGGVAKQGARDLSVIENPYSSLAEGQGTIVIAASQPDQKSWEHEDLRHGIFTYHLIEALQGAADFDHNGEVTVWEVVEYLKNSVPQTAQKFVNENQTPYWRGEGFGDIKLTVNSEIIRELRLKDDKVYQEKRSELLNLYGKLPQKMLDEGLKIIQLNATEMNENQTDISKFLNLLIKKEITVEQYKKYYRFIYSDTKPAEKSQAVGLKTESRSMQKSERKFCIFCGHKIIHGTKFCIKCGTKL